MRKFKLSFYNSHIRVTSNLDLIYNSKSDRCIITKRLDQDLTAKFIEKIKNQTPDLFNHLCAIGAVVEEQRDEISEVVGRSLEIQSNEQLFKLIINPTLDCNFRCWYCYESHIVGSVMENKTLENVCKLIDNILSTKSNLKYFMISFFGGEPLLHYNTTTRVIIDYIRSKYEFYNNIRFEISFTSNAYLLNDSIINHLIEGEENKHFQITLDGGEREHNKVRHATSNNSFRCIINSIKCLIHNEIDVLLRINYTAKNIDSTKDIVKYLKDIPFEDKARLKVGFFRVWQDDKTVILDEKLGDIKYLFEECGLTVTQDDYLLDNYNNPCYADLENELIVNYNGDIFKCTARDFASQNRYGVLNNDGKIVWNYSMVEGWKNSKIKLGICKKCKILPLCGGGCHQVNKESKNMDTCLMGFNEKDKEQIVMNRLSRLFIKNEET